MLGGKMHNVEEVLKRVKNRGTPIKSFLSRLLKKEKQP